MDQLCSRTLLNFNPLSAFLVENRCDEKETKMGYIWLSLHTNMNFFSDKLFLYQYVKTLFSGTLGPFFSKFDWIDLSRIPIWLRHQKFRIFWKEFLPHRKKMTYARKILKFRLISSLASLKYCITLKQRMFPMFPFDLPENISKPKVFWCFQGDLK